MERLIHHEWRGNVRELRNVVERAIILFPNMQINADQVDTLFRRRNSNAPTTQLVREPGRRSEEHTSELQSLMRISYAVFCLKKKKNERKKVNTKRTD